MILSGITIGILAPPVCLLGGIWWFHLPDGPSLYFLGKTKQSNLKKWPSTDLLNRSVDSTALPEHLSKRAWWLKEICQEIHNFIQFQWYWKFHSFDSSFPVVLLFQWSQIRFITALEVPRKGACSTHVDVCALRFQHSGLSVPMLLEFD
jgi:hypothetical protein